MDLHLLFPLLVIVGLNDTSYLRKKEYKIQQNH